MKNLNSLSQILASQSLLYENKIAIKDHDIELTYGELDLLTNIISNNIENIFNGRSTTQSIPLIFKKRIWFIVAAIAVLKTGRAYIPIDAKYPEARIHQILLDSNTQAFITDDHLDIKMNLLSTGISLVAIQFDTLKKLAKSSSTICKFTSTTDLACIMYTSGSTGRPKGVMITHKGIIRATYQPKYIGLSHQDVIISHSNLTFDASTFEIWGALLNGGTIVCLETHEMLDYRALKDAIETHTVSVLWQTTSVFNYFVRQGSQHIYDTLRLLLIGGEIVNKKILKRYLSSTSRKCTIINGYGPTENTIFSTTKKFKDEADLSDKYEQVAIGLPIDRSLVLIVNENLEVILDGEVGELLLGGAGLSRGYLNNSTLTDQQFIELADEKGLMGKYYRSGDWGFYGDDGQIYYVGRKDNQVKLNGFRIELSEIINAIMTYPGIEEAVIKVFDSTDPYLAVYFISSSTELDLKTLRVYLAKLLPTYMIPRYFVVLTEIPRNANQKIDLIKLPTPLNFPGLLFEKKEDNPFLGTIEKQIANIWQQILGHDQFTIESNFFDIGGDSIKLTNLHHQLEEKFGKSIHLLDLYRCSNIASITENLITDVICQDNHNE